MSDLPRVLIVDASRVIRASLARHLKDHFEIREETNGESAWQTLVLDSSIVAVISGLHLPKLDGVGLIERLRANRLRRLNGIPFFLVVSDAVSEGERQQARVKGVSDFIPKGLGSADMERVVGLVARHLSGVGADDAASEGGGQFRVAPQSEGGSYTGVQSDIGVSDILGQMGGLAGLSGGAGDEPAVAATASTEFPTRQDVELRLLDVLPAAGQGQAVGVLIFGLDSYGAVGERFGPEMADKIALKFARLLANKVRSDDSIGHYSPGRIAIVAPGTNRALCASFAERVCKGLAAAQIAVRGQRIDMTVSVGIAAMPEDGVAMSAGELLTLADGRLDSAVRAGGNRVMAGAAASGREFRQDEFLRQLKEVLSAPDPESLVPCLGNVGLQIMPILKQIEQSFRLGLPIEDIERRLWARARAERLVL